MNFRSFIRLLGIVINLISGSMLLSLAWAAFEFNKTNSLSDQNAVIAIAYSIGTGGLLGALLFVFGKWTKKIDRKTAFLLVSSCWFVGAGIGALPFYFWANISSDFLPKNLEFLSFINCYFEAMSGLTTTGASILGNIESIPKGILFWRAQIQWLGGLGIVVLFVAVLPAIGSGNKKLFQAETTGISKDSDTPKIQAMARQLWLIYLAITMLEAVILRFTDETIDWFQAITFSFSTAATAGFSVLNQSAGSISPSSQWVLIFFMFLAGINYALFYKTIHSDKLAIFKDAEFRAYSIILAIAIALITISIYGTPYLGMANQPISSNALKSITDATFQAVSIQTTTGFSNVDSNSWPLFTHLILFGLMFIGGCGGSTGGGIKVARVLGCFKLIMRHIEKVYRPKVVRPIRIGKKILSDSQGHGILIHILFVCIMTMFSTMLLVALEYRIDFMTALSASAATLNNIGPGFSTVGATGNYFAFSDISKAWLTFLMVTGRLEVFTVIVMFFPKFWRDA
jgi:trk system potassium uptake protein